MKARLALLLLTAAVLLPFLDKPFHIDDTIFLWAAKEIRADPLHPYRGEYNWYRSPRPAWFVNNNPPLNSYLLAAVETAARGREWVYHLFYLILAGGCVLLMHDLASRFCRHPSLAVFLTLASPAFLVSATNVMADIPLMLFWVLGVFFTVRAAEPGRETDLWLAGLAAAAAVTTKYFGLGLCPLLIVFWFVRTRRWSVHVLGLLLPLAAFFLWGWYSKIESGVFHPLKAAKLSAELTPSLTLQIAHTMSFLGGGLVWPLFLVPLLFRLDYRAAALGVVLSALTLGLCMEKIPEDMRAVWGVFAIGGICLVVFALWGRPRNFDGDAALLGLWFLGTLAFSTLVNWTVNTRIILPAVFPAAVLVLRRIESMDGGKFWTDWTVAAGGLALVVAVLLALADGKFAGASRTFAETTVRGFRTAGNRVLFAGHWGFQYYMEREGATPFNYSKQDILQGDLIVMPSYNTNMREINVGKDKIGEWTFANPYPFQLMSPASQAGFYTSLWGPVPFAFNKERLVDRFVVYRVNLAKK